MTDAPERIKPTEHPDPWDTVEFLASSCRDIETGDPLEQTARPDLYVADVWTVINDLQAMEAEIERLRAELASGSFYEEAVVGGLINHVEAVEAEVERLRSINAEMAELLSRAVEMTGEPECWYDHHGYCQAHNLEPKGECWVERAIAIIDKEVGE